VGGLWTCVAARSCGDCLQSVIQGLYSRQQGNHSVGSVRDAPAVCFPDQLGSNRLGTHILKLSCSVYCCCLYCCCLYCCCTGLEIVLTLGAAYGCYFVSEELCGASGLLAVVVMGFSMSLLGKGGDSVCGRVGAGLRGVPFIPHSDTEHECP
jgi:hypothetical protein